MVDELIKIIRIFGIVSNEIEINLIVDNVLINTIEWYPEDGDIVLHIFDDDLDIEIYFSDMSLDNQKIIYRRLSQILYN